jgi:hypothetical protein
MTQERACQQDVRPKSFVRSSFGITGKIFGDLDNQGPLYMSVSLNDYC